MNGNSKQGTCQDYLRGSNCANGASAIVSVSYKAKIENVGGDCLRINKAFLKVGNTVKHKINASNKWSDERRNFCPDNLTWLTTSPSNVDLCNFENSEVDVDITLNNGGKGRTGQGVIVFPQANSIPNSVPTFAPVVTLAPTSNIAPTVISPIVPSPSIRTNAPSAFNILPSPNVPTCGFKPKHFDLKIQKRECAANESFLSRSLSHGKKKKKGKGSQKNQPSQPSRPCQCQSCEDHDSFSLCSDLRVTIYSYDDPNEILYTHSPGFGQIFRVTIDPMPSCLIVELSGVIYGKVQKIQTTSFKASCSNDLSIGAVFGAITIVNFE
jgi:hypothetical protein